MDRKILLMLIACLATQIQGFLKGAPTSACENFTPLHRNTQAATSYPPYSMHLVAGVGKIRLTIGSHEGQPFKGFIINARDVQSGNVIGEFTNLPANVQTIECPPGALNNTVTHRDNEEKRNVEFDWIVPESYEGQIVFNATFVQDYSTYWVGVTSSVVTITRDSIDVMSTPAPSTERTSSTTPDYSDLNEPEDSSQLTRHQIYEGCEVTKNCFGAPSGCISSASCQAMVAVEVKGEKYVFEALGTSGKYVAVGLSTDNKMGEDSIVECTNEDGKMQIHMSWNYGQKNRRISTPDGAITSQIKTIDNGVLYCKFLRDKTTVIEGHAFDLSNNRYYLLLAAGKELKSNGVGYHDIIRLASSELSLAVVGEIAAASDILIRLHGALMIASWIGTASVGMLLARYYKQTWRSSQMCGKDHWFVWHRFFMVLTWAMTVAAFVIIFVQIGKWSSYTIHAALGLATTVLAFIQPFMAAMRPHPGTPRRPLFNWAHWFVGNAAHICAIVALFFAVRVNSALIPEWVDWILTAYVVFHVVTHIVLSFAGCASDKQDNQSINAFPMKDMHIKGSMGHPDVNRDAPLAGFRKLVFGVYFIIIVGFTAALIVIVVMAPIEDSWNKLRKMALQN